MKRTFLKLALFTVILCAAVCLFSCDEGCDKNGHKWSDATCTSAKVCSECKEVDGSPLGHDYSVKNISAAAKKSKASTCAEKDTYWLSCSRCAALAKDDTRAMDKWFEGESGAHNVSADWITENGEHFRKCVTEGCDHVADKAACYGGEATCQKKAECSVCGIEYGTLGAHSIDTSVWGHVDATGHAHKCRLCTYNENVTAHTPNIEHATLDTAKVCIECNFIIEQRLDHVHTEASAWKYNSTHHWHDCVDNDGQEFGKAQHTFDDDCDTTCNGGCGYVRAVTHDYSVIKKEGSVHWYECSVCGSEKPSSRVAHTYSGAVTKAPKTFETGTRVHTCICQDSYSETIPATKSLKLLAIGNSFSEDAFAHLYLVCKDAGIEELVLGNLFIGGCSLEKHYSKMTTDAAEYTFFISDPTSGGMIKYDSGTKQTAEFGIEYTEWDYITLQQNSANSGISDSYEWLDDVIAYVKQHKTSESAELYWHMTWAYQGDSTHSSFPNYNNDQLTMYNAILSCVNNVVLANPDIKGVVPSGTSIQNLRNSHVGDTLTRDGHHLSYGIGRYTASLTYLAAITGYDINGISATPSSYSDVASHLPCIKEAVTNAISKPYQITPSVDYPYVAPPGSIVNTTLSPLAEADRDFLTLNGYDPDRYMLLDLEITEHAYYNSSASSNFNVLVTTGDLAKKYLATQIFSRNELPNGSLIRNDSTYKYRPDAWVDLENRNTYTRPGNVETSGITVVDDAWWLTSDPSVSYNYRAFNIYGPNNPISASEASNFRIYVPVASKSELTDADWEFLYGLGLDPGNYMVLDYTYTLHGYYNASNGDPFKISTGSSALHKEFICTNEKFTRYDIPLGSVIHIVDTDYRYRAEGWVIPTQNVASADRPGRVTTETVTVDVAWWADWGYRAFNIQTKNSAQMADPGEKILLRIYVPVEREYVGLTENDREYLEGIGLNADEYKVLNIDYTVGAFYDASSNGSSLNPNHSTLSKRFIGTGIYTRDQLTVGSVIRIAEGYQYRPEGWVALNQKVNDRPVNVTEETVIVDDAWWGDWNYRGFNVSSTESGHVMTSGEASVFRIYVKIA